MDIRITVGGDPVGGWLVDIHDGERNAAYSPEAQTAKEAHEKAWAAHAAAHGVTVQMPPYPEPEAPDEAAEQQTNAAAAQV